MSFKERTRSEIPGTKQIQSSKRRRHRSVTVGEDITCPAQIATNGTIRIRSERAAQVARWFGLDRQCPPAGVSAARAPRDRCAPAVAPPQLALRPGTITLIAGPSGAGKSTLLQAARAAHANRRWIDLATIAAPDAPLVDCFGDLPLRAVLGLLARVGLGEAWTYLRTPAELSEGQRWRFRLALALHDAAENAAAADTAAPAPAIATDATADSDPTAAIAATAPATATPAAAHDTPVIVCDEFAAVLDRVTAMIVAHRLRRAIDALPHAAALVATSHEDIEPALSADVVARCDFGRVEQEEKE